MNTRLNQFRVSNDAVDDAEELRRRLDEEGYIFIKKLQDPDKLLALRQDIMQVISTGGWLIEAARDATLPPPRGEITHARPVETHTKSVDAQ